MSSYYDVPPISVEGCMIPYYAVETLQAAVHFVLTIFALILSITTLASICCKKTQPGMCYNIFK